MSNITWKYIDELELGDVAKLKTGDLPYTVIGIDKSGEVEFHNYDGQTIFKSSGSVSVIENNPPDNRPTRLQVQSGIVHIAENDNVICNSRSSGNSSTTDARVTCKKCLYISGWSG